MAAPVRQLLRMIPRRRRGQLVLIGGLMPLAALAELVTISALIPLLALLTNASIGKGASWMARLVAQIGMRTGTEPMVTAAGLFALAAILAAVLRLILSWATQRFAYGLGHDWMVEIQRRILLQPYAFHLQRNSSQIVAALAKVERLVFSVVLQLLQTASALIMSLFIVAALLMIDATSAAIAALFVASVYAAGLLAIRGRLAGNSNVIGESYERRIQTVQESLGGIRDIILDHSQAPYVEAFRSIDERFMRAAASSAFISSAPRFVIEALGLLLLVGVAIVLSERTGGLANALPVLGALALAAQRLLPLTQTLYNGWTTLAAEQAIVADVVELLTLPVAVAKESPPGPPIAFAREIRFDQVGFHYPGRAAAAVGGIDLVIPRGERIALIGRTGAGKSTLADLLMGLLEPGTGHITIDGVVLNHASVRAWQKNVAHVPQAIFLADGSIARNIAFGEPAQAIDLARVDHAASVAQLVDFIATLPEGYETMVGERGVRLSGGQRQRLGVARAVYKGASVLILDEATSALDEETEEALMGALDRLGAEGRTILIVAHRKTTIRSCDRIVRLDHGRIVETGSYEQLFGPREPRPGEST
ncbi:MAG: ABC transporter ATP-binding protein/permease [Sphingomonas sp.]|uniref:ABC transporter ATP-binding protein n=1 Tax=Sphingomonas sp. TaxID=28214 RepID=UPI0017CB7DD5|nr:ABC transporter ATP-binding protein/permease [Sphingomonas sp.]MBA3666274.1 ABC transporter ATP-binding protein/permease [Sphingomonas sp.]